MKCSIVFGVAKMIIFNACLTPLTRTMTPECHGGMARDKMTFLTAFVNRSACSKPRDS